MNQFYSKPCNEGRHEHCDYGEECLCECHREEEACKESTQSMIKKGYLKDP